MCLYICSLVLDGFAALLGRGSRRSHVAQDGSCVRPILVASIRACLASLGGERTSKGPGGGPVPGRREGSNKGTMAKPKPSAPSFDSKPDHLTE